MATRLPVDFIAEYRGVKPATQFTKRETGETIDVAAKLKLELSRDDGDVDLVEIGAASLERLTPPVDPGTLKRGALIHITGEAVIQERGSENDSYFRLTTFAPAEPTKLRQAA